MSDKILSLKKDYFSIKKDPSPSDYIGLTYPDNDVSENSMRLFDEDDPRDNFPFPLTKTEAAQKLMDIRPHSSQYSTQMSFDSNDGYNMIFYRKESHKPKRIQIQEYDSEELDFSNLSSKLKNPPVV